MLVDCTNIKEYIPQREPFLMIDRLRVISEEVFEGYYTVDESNPLTDVACVSSSIMIEFFAQTCAAGFGYLTRGQDVTPGFIGSISKLTVHNTPAIGDTITSRVLIKNKFENIQLIEGKVMLDGITMLECRMKIVSP
jgi:predicted hotdog family 3-hydroxylacyl-ACP dehydratase